MTPLSREQFADMTSEQGVKKKLRAELKFAPEAYDWPHYDFVTVFDKARQKGVLLYEGRLYSVTLSPRKPNASGKTEPVICDICATWRRGSESALLTFQKSDRSTIGHLVCADLDCSLHVRNLTRAATLSRTQLREDIDTDGRIARLQARLGRILGRLV